MYPISLSQKRFVLWVLSLARALPVAPSASTGSIIAGEMESIGSAANCIKSATLPRLQGNFFVASVIMQLCYLGGDDVSQQLKTVVLFAALLALCSGLPGQAENAVQRDDFLKSVANTSDYPHTQVVDRLMSVEMSAPMWQYYAADTRNANTITHFASEIMMMAKKMGWGDIWQVTGGSPYQTGDNPELQPQNPAIVQMIDSWKNKVHITLIMNEQGNGDLAQKTLDNVELVCTPMEDPQFKPRGDKLFMTITAAPNVTTYSIKTDPDKTKFDISVPVFQNYSQTFFGQALLKAAR
jgi:hypothetical protein